MMRGSLQLAALAVLLVSALALPAAREEDHPLAPNQLRFKAASRPGLKREDVPAEVALHMWQGTAEDRALSDSYGDVDPESLLPHAHSRPAISMSFAAVGQVPTDANTAAAPSPAAGVTPAAAPAPTPAATATPAPPPAGVAPVAAPPPTAAPSAPSTPAATAPAAPAANSATPSPPATPSAAPSGSTPAPPAAGAAPAPSTPSPAGTTPPPAGTPAPTASAPSTPGATPPPPPAGTTPPTPAAGATPPPAGATPPPAGSTPPAPPAGSTPPPPAPPAGTNPPPPPAAGTTPPPPPAQGQTVGPAATFKADGDAASSVPADWKGPWWTYHGADDCVELGNRNLDNPEEIRVLSFNVWDNLSHSDDGPSTVAQLIRNLKANVIGLQEAKMEVVEEIARRLGAPYQAYFPACIISTYPPYRSYKEEPGHERDVAWFGSVSFEVKPGIQVKFANGHNFANNSTKLLRDGTSAKQVLEMVRKLNHGSGGMYNPLTYNVFSPLNDPDLPTILMGDHNEPSILDHNSATARNNDFNNARHAKVVPIQWPISSLLKKKGFADSYRTIHPDLGDNRNWGFTWHRDSPSALITDRIDYIYSKNGRVGDWFYDIKPVFSEVLHSDSCTWADEDVQKGKGKYKIAEAHKWPSDHNALFSIFTIDKRQT